jgi:hypothetical protein
VQIKSAEDYVRCLSSMTQDDYKKMASELSILGTQVKNVGLKFAYHNHNMEFRRRADGTTTWHDNLKTNGCKQENTFGGRIVPSL